MKKKTTKRKHSQTSLSDIGKAGIIGVQYVSILTIRLF